MKHVGEVEFTPRWDFLEIHVPRTDILSQGDTDILTFLHNILNVLKIFVKIQIFF